MANHYGDLVIFDKPTFDKETRTWVTRLGSTYPQIVTDDMSGEVLVDFLNLKELGTIKLDNNFKIIDATSSKKCDKRLSGRLDLWKQQTEKLVVSASSEIFANIAKDIHVLNPLELILDQLVHKKDSKIKILDADIQKQNNSARIMQYIDLLEELEIIQRVKDGYTRGNILIELLQQEDNPEKLKTSLLLHVIKQKYSTLCQVFGIKQLEPYVHLANTYYSASMQAGKLIHISKSNLFQRYQNHYKNMTRWEFDSKLYKLIAKGALWCNGDYLIGDPEHFANMLQMKSKIQLNPITS